MSSGQKVVIAIIALLAGYLLNAFADDWRAWNTPWACEFLRMPGQVFHTSLYYVDETDPLILVWPQNNPARHHMFNRAGIKVCWRVEDG